MIYTFTCGSHIVEILIWYIVKKNQIQSFSMFNLAWNKICEYLFKMKPSVFQLHCKCNLKWIALMCSFYLTNYDDIVIVTNQVETTIIWAYWSHVLGNWLEPLLWLLALCKMTCQNGFVEFLNRKLIQSRSASFSVSLIRIDS